MAFPEDRRARTMRLLKKRPTQPDDRPRATVLRPRATVLRLRAAAPDPSAAALHPSAASFVRAQPPMARTRALEIVRNRSVAFLLSTGTARSAILQDCAGWRNGRRVGLKNRYRKVCGFESHPGTTSSPAIARQLIHPTTADVIFHIRVFRYRAPGTPRCARHPRRNRIKSGGDGHTARAASANDAREHHP